MLFQSLTCSKHKTAKMFARLPSAAVGGDKDTCVDRLDMIPAGESVNHI